MENILNNRLKDYLKKRFKGFQSTLERIKEENEQNKKGKGLVFSRNKIKKTLSLKKFFQEYYKELEKITGEDDKTVKYWKDKLFVIIKTIDRNIDKTFEKYYEALKNKKYWWR